MVNRPSRGESRDAVLYILVGYAFLARWCWVLNSDDFRVAFTGVGLIVLFGLLAWWWQASGRADLVSRRTRLTKLWVAILLPFAIYVSSIAVGIGSALLEEGAFGAPSSPFLNPVGQAGMLVVWTILSSFQFTARPSPPPEPRSPHLMPRVVTEPWWEKYH